MIYFDLMTIVMDIDDGFYTLRFMSVNFGVFSKDRSLFAVERSSGDTNLELLYFIKFRLPFLSK
jgi:hypothetical protein